MNYVYEYGDNLIPVTLLDNTNRINLQSQWGLFEVTATSNADYQAIGKFIKSRKQWIYSHKTRYQNKITEMKHDIESNRYALENRNKQELRDIILMYVRKYEHIRGSVNRVSIRNDLKRKWASCSYKKNLTFGNILSYLPEHLIEYIVYHELCHLTVRNHSNDFYKLIKEEFHDYKKYDKELETYHYMICHRQHEEKIKEYVTNILQDNIVDNEIKEVN